MKKPKKKLYNLVALKNEFSALIDEHHDYLVAFRVRRPDTILVRICKNDVWETFFEILLVERIEDSFTIYENKDKENKLNYVITDKGRIKDLERCRFDLIDVYASSDTLLIHGCMWKSISHFGKDGVKTTRKRLTHEAVVKICNIDFIKIEANISPKD